MHLVAASDAWLPPLAHAWHSRRSLQLQALDIDGDNNNDLVLALDGKAPTIWVNPGLATSGIAPTGSTTANEGITFPLDVTLPPAGATDVTLADINGDGRTDILLAYGTGFEVVLAPALPSPTTVSYTHLTLPTTD